jgi:hypothetical protein
MAHMKLSAWVGKHGEAIEFFFVRIFSDFKGLVVCPKLLGFSFYLSGVIYYV